MGRQHEYKLAVSKDLLAVNLDPASVIAHLVQRAMQDLSKWYSQ
jgi:hypothetical protein